MIDAQSPPEAGSPLHGYRRCLPHWRLDGATYFVTWKLHDGQPELAADERTLVASALRHFEEVRYRLLAFVVMDDHVHVLVRPKPGVALESVVNSWKSFTTNQLHRLGRRGRVWQVEYHDRIVRSQDELLQKAHYIWTNPQRRWPDGHDYEWVWMQA